MKRNFKGFMGLNYIDLRNVPSVKSDSGSAIHAASLQQLERQVAEALLEYRVPIRGLEIRFMRQSFGLSLKEFGKALELSDVAILKWEKQPMKRVSLVNEIAVRAWISAQLKLPVDSSLLMGDVRVQRIVVDFANPKNGSWAFDHLRDEYPGLAAAG